jgi:3-hydroxy-9,10-secoandrosta-1,3,5(10)-triene-9,17-dione monooxygenase
VLVIPSPETLVNDARLIAPVVAERRYVTHEKRDVSADVIAQMQEAGLMRILQPKAYGGYEMDPRVYFDVQNIFAESCLSTAWVYGVLVVQAFFLSLFGERALQDVWGKDPRALVCSSFFPKTTVKIVDGGYRLTGQWPYASGSTHAHWALLGGLLPPASAESSPEMRLFVVPRQDFQIVDTWRSFGLRGTGSNDLRVDNAFVPEHRAWKPDNGYIGNQRADLPPLYRMPWLYSLGTAVVNLAVGGGRGAINAFLGLRGRTPGAPGYEAEQLALANLEAEIDTTNVQIRQHIEVMLGHIAAGRPISLLEGTLYRRLQTGMVRRIVAGVDELMMMTGSRGIDERGPLTLTWLDLCASRHHIGNTPFESGLLLAGAMKEQYAKR